MKKVVNIFIAILSVLLLVFSGALIYQNTVYYRVIVVGTSMDETLKEGDIGACKKIKFQSKISQSNIIVFDKGNDYEIIKRVIGVPGDRVVIKNDGVYINDKIYEEKYISEKNKLETGLHGSLEFYDVTLNENEYYVMGDNRKDSYDSRYYGPIKKENIKGKLSLIYAHCECSNYCDECNNKSNLKWTFF